LVLSCGGFWSLLGGTKDPVQTRRAKETFDVDAVTLARWQFASTTVFQLLDGLAELTAFGAGGAAVETLAGLDRSIAGHSRR
jgi:hypothetical protein